HAVDVVIELVARLPPPLDPLAGVLDVVVQAELWSDAEAECAEPLQNLVVFIRGGASLIPSELIDVDRERPARRYARVELAHGARRGVAGIGVEGLSAI